jgi:hypothetical protein
MTEVLIRNKNLLNKLNGFVDEFFSISGYNDEYYRMHDGDKALTDPEYYCGREWLDHMLLNWENHSGYPEQHFSQPISRMATASSFFSARRPQIASDPPAAAIPSAMPRPIPELPPVITKTLPDRSAIPKH